MREYVRLPEELLTMAGKRGPWIARSLEYAEGIKPKAPPQEIALWHRRNAGFLGQFGTEKSRLCSTSKEATVKKFVFALRI